METKSLYRNRLVIIFSTILTVLITSFAFHSSAFDQKAFKEQTSWSYANAGTKIEIQKKRFYQSDTWVAEIETSQSLPGHFYAKNGLQSVKKIAAPSKSIFAVNATGFSSANAPMGTVGSNGQIDTYIAHPSRDSLLMRTDGTLEILPRSYSKEDIERSGDFSWIVTFGPTLVQNAINVQNNNRTKEYAPRTAIGQKPDGTYVVVVVDGRSKKSRGVSLRELGIIMRKEGVHLGYNLDGGGSSTLLFRGHVLNNPSDSAGARPVYDIISFK
ncbi:MAG: phosphodiester glycosidase family protein [Bacilli bacterium]